MKLYTIYFSNGISVNVLANGINFYENVVIDMEFFVDGEVVAEFNSEHIAGYTIEDCPTQTEFQRKADASFAEGCYLDQGITQCF